ncbi:MAG: PP2C family serine/threonine-protein phosphatase [Ferruginibacter sp.]
MNDVKEQLQKIFKNNNIDVEPNSSKLFDKFMRDEMNTEKVKLIIENQEWLMSKWKVENAIDEIIRKPIHVLNATVGKPFETRFNFEQFGWKNIIAFEFDGLSETGLSFDEKTKMLIGKPLNSGDIKIKFKFKVEGQGEDDPFNEKFFTLIINPDPKTLWKNLPSDKNDPYWKEDNITEFAPLGEKHILVSSKRGRSHANVGSFREDDYAFKDFQNNWSIVVVSDGAGSAPVSRKGSAIACAEIVEYFMQPAIEANFRDFDNLMQVYHPDDTETTKKIQSFLYNNLGQAAFDAHKKLESFATETGITLKDLSATLVFTLFKKYEKGYAFLSFGVGDCPMAVLNKAISEVTLLNWIDVGEFGGGTRFITMPEIFQNEKFATRLSFQLIDDFSYLVLMSDGIYDPKLVVESNLLDIKKWKAFLEDLNGKNDDQAKVVLESKNQKIKEEFSKWMDFWSIGNHDDRTLAIIF